MSSFSTARSEISKGAPIGVYVHACANASMYVCVYSLAHSDIPRTPSLSPLQTETAGEAGRQGDLMTSTCKQADSDGSARLLACLLSCSAYGIFVTICSRALEHVRVFVCALDRNALEAN